MRKAPYDYSRIGKKFSGGAAFLQPHHNGNVANLTYQARRNAIWILRDRLVCAVILPKAESVGDVFGTSNWTWFRTLKNSQRYSRLKRSAMWVFLTTAKSTLLMPSARRFENWLGKVRMFDPSCAADAVTKRVVSNAPLTPRGSSAMSPPR